MTALAWRAVLANGQIVLTEKRPALNERGLLDPAEDYGARLVVGVASADCRGTIGLVDSTGGTDAGGGLRPKVYEALSRCVDNGCNYGYNRAHKHMDEGQVPSQESLVERIASAVMDEIAENFHVDD